VFVSSVLAWMIVDSVTGEKSIVFAVFAAFMFLTI